MGLRFSKRIRIAPGLRLNLSKSGVSASIGRRGAWLTFGGRRKPRITVGIPGSGLSYSQQLGGPAPKRVPVAESTTPNAMATSQPSQPSHRSGGVIKKILAFVLLTILLVLLYTAVKNV